MSVVITHITSVVESIPRLLASVVAPTCFPNIPPCWHRSTPTLGRTIAQVHSFKLLLYPLVLDIWLPQARGVQNAPSELSWALIRSWHAQFKCVLTNTLLTTITVGVYIGQPLLQMCMQRAFRHPEVIDQELGKECNTGCILGPLWHLPSSLQCSGLGTIPEKNSEWRMITHLSAPANRIVNEGIRPDEFTLHYISVDDSVGSSCT